VSELFADPVTGGGEGRKQEAAEDDLLAERSEGDGEGPQGPDGGGGVEQVVHGGFGGEVEEFLEREGDEEASDAGGHQFPPVTADGGEVPLQAVEQGAAP